jgi:hypothetical protein
MTEKSLTINRAVVVIIMAVTVPIFLVVYQQADAFRAEDGSRLTTIIQKAPITISGDNIYVVWWTNQTANGDGEVMFRVSNDSGATFADKINLSNNTVTNSVDAEIAADDDKVIVTWWERNSTSNEPVMRISNDNGQTFWPVLKLANNGTTGQAAAEE